VKVDVFRQSKGRSITRLKRVKAFRGRKRSFTWKARGLRNGHYVVRFQTQPAIVQPYVKGWIPSSKQINRTRWLTVEKGSPG